MIHYQLRCGAGHEFEGWFRDSASFDLQAETGLLSCPACGTTEVGRGLMAPAVRTRKVMAPADAQGVPATVSVDPAGAEASRAGALPAASADNQAGMPLPDQLRAVLQKVRAHVERNCDNVGDEFAAEALRMHRGKAAVRGIYGNASENDRETLADEGIDVMQIPWLKPAES